MDFYEDEEGYDEDTQIQSENIKRLEKELRTAKAERDSAILQLHEALQRLEELGAGDAY